MVNGNYHLPLFCYSHIVIPFICEILSFQLNLERTYLTFTYSSTVNPDAAFALKTSDHCRILISVVANLVSIACPSACVMCEKFV